MRRLREPHRARIAGVEFSSGWLPSWSGRRGYTKSRSEMLPEEVVDGVHRENFIVRRPVGVAFFLERDQLGLFAGFVERLFHGFGLRDRHHEVFGAVNE